MNRRSFLTSILATCTAPAIIPYASLMKPKYRVVPGYESYTQTTWQFAPKHPDFFGAVWDSEKQILVSLQMSDQDFDRMLKERDYRNEYEILEYASRMGTLPARV